MVKIIELFSGIGTQRKAFENIFGKDNVSVIATSEIDKRAIKAYTLIHGDDGNNLKDIREIKSLPSADVWTYSFPCTDISIAGKKKGFEGEHSSLLFQVNRLLECSPKPKVLIMENVVNLVGPQFINDFKKWIDYLSKMGYITTWKKMKANEYGSTTIRNRVFAVSILGNEKYSFPKEEITNKTVIDILEPSLEENKIDNLLLYKNEEKNFKKSIKIGEYGSGGQGNCIYSVFGQGVTLTASGGGKGGSGGGLYAREDGIYKLSAAEMVKIMGWSQETAKILSENFSRSQVGFLMGNSIDLRVMEFIVKGLKAQRFLF